MFRPTWGGTAVCFDEDARRLGGKGVHVLATDVPGAGEFDRTSPNRIHRLRLVRVAWLRPESLYLYAKLLVASLWWAITRRVDVVLAGRALPEGLVAWAVGWVGGRRVLTFAHGEELTGWGRGSKFRAMCFALQRADWVLANSDYTRETLVSLIGVGPERIAVVYPAVDPERFHPGREGDDLRAGIGLSGSHRLILSVGRLVRHKGFDNVLRALRLMGQQAADVHYALAGIGEDREYLRLLAAELGVSERVHFLGLVSDDDLPRWYAACDVFAMPNREVRGITEGFGIVFLEAAATAKPAVAGRAGGTASAVVDGETGLRVNGEDIEAIARALTRLLRDRDLAAAMGCKARQRVVAGFHYRRREQQLRDLAWPGSEGRAHAGPASERGLLARSAGPPLADPVAPGPASPLRELAPTPRRGR